MRNLLAIFAVSAMIWVSQVHAGALAPQIIAKYDRNFIERSGAQTIHEMLDTGIIRYFFTGGRNLLVMINGRAYATTAGNLDSIPLSAVERIEVIRAESLGTFGGHAAVRGAVNIVLRKDLNGFDVRTVARMPRRDGGDARQGSAVWGGSVGDGGRMTVGIDILDRQEIVGSTREHSRSEWMQGGSFGEAKNVSVGGNTVYIFDKDQGQLRTVPLGDCDPALGYTGPLSNPPGISSGDKGCGFAYGNIWWDSASHGQENTILNFSHPLGEHSELHVDANVTQGREFFRYAPSVDVFGITPNQTLLNAINAKADEYGNRQFDAVYVENELDNDTFAIGHRFIGHGNRDWKTKSEEYDVSASVRGRLSEGLGYDASIRAYSWDRLTSGDTFVHAPTIRTEIREGRYDLTNPLSTAEAHMRAIERSGLSEKDDFGAKYLGSRIALEGTGPSIGTRNTAWTAGVEFTNVKAHRQLEFRDNQDMTYSVDEVLGSGGTSYAGKRDTVGIFTELSLPLADSLNVRAATRADDYDDVGGLRAWRLGAEYHLNDTVTFRGSLSTGDSPPSMYRLYSTASQDHPYVRCVPQSWEQPPRTCATNYRQVKRRTTGNPELKPSGSERRSIGFETRKGPYFFAADWYRLETSDLPGQYNATYAILNYPECQGENRSKCIQRAAGEITIHDSFANIVKNEISGVNTRFGSRGETDWGFVAMRGLWRYVSTSEWRIAGQKSTLPLPRHAVRIETSIGRGNLTALWALNYRSDIVNQNGGRFSSWTGHDLTLDWKKPFGLENTRVTAGVYNITDTKLSTNTANPSLTDGPRAAGWGRTFFVTLNMRF